MFGGKVLSLTYKVKLNLSDVDSSALRHAQD